MAPTIDFSAESGDVFQFPKGAIPKAPKIPTNPDYNPFTASAPSTPAAPAASGGSYTHTSAVRDWDTPSPRTTHAVAETEDYVSAAQELFKSEAVGAEPTTYPADRSHFMQIGRQFVATTTKSSLLLIHQQRADERILYELFLKQYEYKSMHAQQLLFPVNIKLNTDEMAAIKELLPEIERFGFRVDFLGSSNMVVNAAPADVKESQIQQVFDEILSDVMQGTALRQEAKISFAKSMAGRLAVKSGQVLSTEEMEQMVNALFACEVPDMSIRGQRIWKSIDFSRVEELFESISN